MISKAISWQILPGLIYTGAENIGLIIMDRPYVSISSLLLQKVFNRNNNIRTVEEKRDVTNSKCSNTFLESYHLPFPSQCQCLFKTSDGSFMVNVQSSQTV